MTPTPTPAPKPPSLRDALQALAREISDKCRERWVRTSLRDAEAGLRDTEAGESLFQWLTTFAGRFEAALAHPAPPPTEHERALREALQRARDSILRMWSEEIDEKKKHDVSTDARRKHQFIADGLALACGPIDEELKLTAAEKLTAAAGGEASNQEKLYASACGMAHDYFDKWKAAEAERDQALAAAEQARAERDEAVKQRERMGQHVQDVNDALPPDAAGINRAEAVRRLVAERDALKQAAERAGLAKAIEELEELREFVCNNSFPNECEGPENLSDAGEITGRIDKRIAALQAPQGPRAADPDEDWSEPTNGVTPPKPEPASAPSAPTGELPPFWTKARGEILSSCGAWEDDDVQSWVANVERCLSDFLRARDAEIAKLRAELGGLQLDIRAATERARAAEWEAEHQKGMVKETDRMRGEHQRIYEAEIERLRAAAAGGNGAARAVAEVERLLTWAGKELDERNARKDPGASWWSFLITVLEERRDTLHAEQQAPAAEACDDPDCSKPKGHTGFHRSRPTAPAPAARAPSAPEPAGDAWRRIIERLRDAAGFGQSSAFSDVDYDLRDLRDAVRWLYDELARRALPRNVVGDQTQAV